MASRHEPPELVAPAVGSRTRWVRRAGIAFAALAATMAAFLFIWCRHDRSLRLERITTQCADAELAADSRQGATAVSLCSEALADLDAAHEPSAFELNDDRVTEDRLRARLLKCRGRSRWQSMDLEGAAADLSAAQRLSPDNAEIAIDLGDTFLRQNRFGEAIREYDRALEHDPGSARALGNRGAAKRFSGDVDGAVADLTKSLEIDANGARAHYNLGICLAARGDGAAAEREFDASIAADDVNPDCRYRRGLLRVKSNRFADAEQDFDRAIELDPGRAQSWSSRAAVRLMLGEVRAASEDARQAVALDPRDGAARELLHHAESAAAAPGRR